MKRGGTLALSLLLVATAPAFPHCFSVWRYPWAQRCGGNAVKKPDRTWFVEVVKPPPLPIPGDPRTEEQIRDQIGHDAAVAAHKDELNELLRELSAEEEMKAAIPEQKP